MASQDHLSRLQLLSSLKGNSAVLPDMQALLYDWPQHVNPEIDRLHKDVEKYLDTYIILLPLSSCRSLAASGSFHLVAGFGK
jgi:hypothetical protein